MAVLAPDSARATAGAWPPAEELRALTPILRLLGGIWSIESVQKIAFSIEAGQLDLWVLMREEVPDDEGRIISFERDYRNAVGPQAFAMHVVPLSEVDESVLPPAETILER